MALPEKNEWKIGVQGNSIAKQSRSKEDVFQKIMTIVTEEILAYWVALQCEVIPLEIVPPIEKPPCPTSFPHDLRYYLTSRQNPQRHTYSWN